MLKAADTAIKAAISASTSGFNETVYHDVHIVVETFWEQRTDGAVDQTAGQRFVFAGLGFALEETAGDLACCIGFLDVVNRQGEEVLASFGDLRAHHGGEHHGVVHVDEHSAAGLASNFAGFHGDRVLAPLEGLGDFVKN